MKSGLIGIAATSYYSADSDLTIAACQDHLPSFVYLKPRLALPEQVTVLWKGQHLFTQPSSPWPPPRLLSHSQAGLPSRHSSGENYASARIATEFLLSPNIEPHWPR